MMKLTRWPDGSEKTAGCATIKPAYVCAECGARGMKMIQTDGVFECYDCARKKVEIQNMFRFAKKHGYAVTKAGEG